MNYVFCGAYEPLLFALYLKSLKKKITVIAHGKNLIKYCEAEKINYIKYNLITLKGSSLFKIFRFKRNMDKLIKNIDFCEKDNFFLTGKKKTIDAFYLAKEFSKKGTVFYYPSGIISESGIKAFKSKGKKPIFIKGEILKMIVKIFLDVDLTYYQGHGIPIVGVDDNFLKKHNIEEYKIDLSPEDVLLNLAYKNKINYQEFDNIIIDSGALTNIIKNDSLVEIYKNLLKLPIEFAFKFHPSRIKEKPDASFYNIFKSCSTVPEYLPVELFFNNVKKNVISVYSASLNTAAQMPHLNSISLLELVNWYDKTSKDHVKNLLIKKSNNKILFPQNFDELKKMVMK